MIDVEIDKILNELKLTPEEFSKEIGASKSTIYKLLGGKTIKITKQTATKISDAFPQYKYRELMELNKKSDDSDYSSDKVFLKKGMEKISINEIYTFIIENEEEILANKSFKVWISEKVYKGMAALSTDSRSE